MSELLKALLVILLISLVALAIGIKLAEIEDANCKPNIEIIHPVESIRCVSQDSKIVFCDSYRE